MVDLAEAQETAASAGRQGLGARQGLLDQAEGPAAPVAPGPR
jgi:hypothetical protein